MSRIYILDVSGGQPRCSRHEQRQQLDYHTRGTSRCRTRCWYSWYPGRLLARRRSSSRSRHIKNGIIAPTATNDHHEPSANGVPRRYKDALAYIGWRTIAYGPVETTF